MRVLVVDDDPSVRGVVRVGLDRFDVVEADDGPGALAVLRRSTVDVVLLDLMMPRMDGFEVLSSIRSEHGDDIAVLVLTGRAAELDHIAAYRLGADGYLVKPFDVDVLCNAVEDASSRSKAERVKVRQAELAQAEFFQRLEQGLGPPVR